MALLIAAAEARAPTIETPWPNRRDGAGLHMEITAAARDGFAGRLCIHPDQLEAVVLAFTRSPERWGAGARRQNARRFKPEVGRAVYDGCTARVIPVGAKVDPCPRRDA